MWKRTIATILILVPAVTGCKTAVASLRLAEDKQPLKLESCARYRVRSLRKARLCHSRQLLILRNRARAIRKIVKQTTRSNDDGTTTFIVKSCLFYRDATRRRYVRMSEFWCERMEFTYRRKHWGWFWTGAGGTSVVIGAIATIIRALLII